MIFVKEVKRASQLAKELLPHRGTFLAKVIIYNKTLSWVFNLTLSAIMFLLSHCNFLDLISTFILFQNLTAFQVFWLFLGIVLGQTHLEVSYRKLVVNSTKCLNVLHVLNWLKLCSLIWWVVFWFHLSGLINCSILTVLSSFELWRSWLLEEFWQSLIVALI